MSKPPLTTGEIAMADQAAAIAGTGLDVLVMAVRLGDEQHGEAQNLANFTALLSERDPAVLAMMVVIAVRRMT